MFYEQKIKELQKGDILFLFTDGVTEAQDSAKEFYGEDRLLSVLIEQSENSPEEICNAIIKDFEAFKGSEPQVDDMVMIFGKVS